MAKMRANWGRTPDGISVKVYLVYNTANKSIYVLARDKTTAMLIAQAANHIYNAEVIHADNYGRDCNEVTSRHPGELKNYWDSVERAVASRVEGTLHIENGKIAVGYEVVA